jgi:hypothetical protein
MSFGEYSFLPWLRRGIGSQLQAPAAAASRAALDVKVRVRSESATADVPPKSVLLIGPGDIIGMNAQMVVRTEPRRGVTNFEPNYLAYVDFYDEDFAWRYTPDVPDAAHRLSPWISLLVLKDEEFVPLQRRPLDAVDLTPAATIANVLPPPTQAWAWAHVHLNASLPDRAAPNLDVLSTMLRANPDSAYCRVISPRHLEPNSGYHAFVIPTFEVGRLAGLGEPVPDTTPGIAISWVAGRRFPIYFRTGAAGDFEELVRALVPRDVDPRVGIRKLDVQQPGFQLPVTNGQPDAIVGLEGALLAPTAQHIPVAPTCDLPANLAIEVNLPAEAQAAGVAGLEDPLISAPLYGRWHALVERVRAFPEQRNWVNELNTDPRFRALAGMGTRVIQRNQESYMKLAWQQIGDVLSLNRKISLLQLSVKTSDALYTRNLASLSNEHVLAVAAPVLRKVMGSPVTLHTQVRQSRMPRATLSGPARKLLRSRGQLAKRAFVAPLTTTPLAQAVSRLNAGTLTTAPPRPKPSGSTYDNTLAEVDEKTPGWLRWLTKHRAIVLLVAAALLTVVAFAVLPVALALVAAVAAGGAGVLLYRRLTPVIRRIETVEAFRPSALTPQAISSLPPNDAFVMPVPGAPAQWMRASGGADSPHGAAFRQAAMQFNQLLSEHPAPAIERAPLNINVTAAKLLTALRPAPAFLLRHGRTMTVGNRALSEYLAAYHDAVQGPVEPRIVPVMAYPDIKLAMYRPLKDLQKDNFVPNLRFVPPDTISLMLTNPPVIEAYMVGLNHEFARELLWREYPTDQRPSTFRQFWDPAHSVDTTGLTAEAFAEKVRDIRRIHEWPAASVLGTHNNRLPNDDRPRVVLVIRGELLKRYPDTIIYAQRARWGDAPDHTNDLTLHDERGSHVEADATDPNYSFPILRAQVEPDIYFIGFDLLLDDVRGDPTLAETAEARARIPANRLGWFFVLQAVVGEPRFGLDEHAVTESEDTLKWDNLSWENLGSPVTMIDLTKGFASSPPGTTDGGAKWGSHAADLAFILYQRPALVAIHARDMLKNLNAGP